MSKLTTCKHCGHEVAKSAKVCPNCGAKLKRPILGIIITIVGVIIIGGVIGNNENTNATPAEQPKEEITYAVRTVHEMNHLLETNAMEAADYKDKYIELTGYIYNKDSDGQYISLDCGDDWCNDCMFNSVMCYMKSQEIKDSIKPITTDTQVTLRVKITSVSEVFGYSCDIIEVVK